VVSKIIHIMILRARSRQKINLKFSNTQIISIELQKKVCTRLRSSLKSSQTRAATNPRVVFASCHNPHLLNKVVTTVHFPPPSLNNSHPFNQFQPIHPSKKCLPLPRRLGCPQPTYSLQLKISVDKLY
jgi:hypothetical protein